MSFCECLNVNIGVSEGFVNFQFLPTGEIIGGAPQFEAPAGETILIIEYDSENNQWILFSGDDDPFASFAGTSEACPFGIWAVFPNDEGVSFVEVSECIDPEDCGCFKTYVIREDGNNGCIELTTPSGIFNSAPYWQFEIGGIFYQIYKLVLSGEWTWGTISAIGDDPSEAAIIGSDKDTGDCPPKTEFGIDDRDWTSLSIEECDPCSPDQERTKREYKSVRLPKIFVEENRGYERCCCEALVLASLTNDSWKNDVTSAWIKVSEFSDITNFNLYKNGVLANYQPVIQHFVKDPLARFVTIQWKDVLQIDGEGCYRLEIEFNIAGVQQTMIWGKYKLKTYSIQTALGTARVRVKFNSYQEIEGIDFTDSLVEDSLRFNGFIGFSQPNTEIDNLIYENREMKKVIRENLRTHELITDPICEEFTRALTELYLLSENEIYLSDYNAHNHSYRYQDKPAIVEQSPEIEYYDFSRSAKLTCILGDKFKNKRSYFK